MDTDKAFKIMEEYRRKKMNQLLSLKASRNARRLFRHRIAPPSLINSFPLNRTPDPIFYNEMDGMSYKISVSKEFTQSESCGSCGKKIALKEEFILLDLFKSNVKIMMCYPCIWDIVDGIGLDKLKEQKDQRIGKEVADVL